jgi:hypothetical protein
MEQDVGKLRNTEKSLAVVMQINAQVIRRVNSEVKILIPDIF